MDDLTPMEPEFRELPPEPAAVDPCYYGTGRAPQKQRPHAAAILSVFFLILTANLVTVGMLLWLRSNAGTQTPEVDVPLTPPTAEQVTQDTPMPDESNALSIQKVPETKLDRAALYEKLAPGLVQLSLHESSAAAVVLTEDGYLLSSASALQGETEMMATLSDGSSHTARLVGCDSSSDLAILKLEVSGLQPVELGASSALRAGDTVYAFSFPFGAQMQATLVEGYIAAVGAVELSGTQLRVLQTTAVLEGFHGPLVNASGQVVAMQVGSVGDYTSYTTVGGIGFALCMDDAAPLITQLMSSGYVSGRASLGVEIVALSEAQRLYWDLPEGVFIMEVRADSAAFRAGLRAGDMLIRINDMTVTDESSYYSALNHAQAGEQVRVVIYRRGIQMYADLTLDEAEDYS